MTSLELKKIEQAIEQAKTKKAQLQGRHESLMQQLNELGVKSLEEADIVLEDLRAKLEVQQTRLNEIETELTQAVDWDSL